MKKIFNLGLVCLMCIGVLAGCAQKAVVEESTVFIGRKGQITSVDVEKLDKDYYDETELQNYIADHIAEYVMEFGETVKQEEFTVEDSVARLKLSYETCEDYCRFNEKELFVGTILEAQAEGYDFAVEFNQVSMEDGEAVVSPAVNADVLADDGYKVAVIRANTTVEVSGKILYVSSENTEVLGKKTVRIAGGESDEEAILSYIIYK